MDFPSLLRHTVIILIPMIFAITLHEAAHAYIAKLRGDDTASQLKRVSINPIRHIHPFGTIILPLLLFFMNSGFLFGWAKPVPINYQKLKKPRLDMALVAIAGPLSNLIMAILWFFALKYINNTGIKSMAEIGIYLNIMLMVFNLLPIPPLDGSRIITSLLSEKNAYSYNKIERYGILIILALAIIPGPNGAPSLLAFLLFPMIQHIVQWIIWIF